MKKLFMFLTALLLLAVNAKADWTFYVDLSNMTTKYNPVYIHCYSDGWWGHYAGTKVADNVYRFDLSNWDDLSKIAFDGYDGGSNHAPNSSNRYGEFTKANNGTVYESSWGMVNNACYKLNASPNGATIVYNYTVPVSVTTKSPQATYPGGVPKQGAVKSGSNVLFCLAAPGKQAVSIKGSWNNYAGQLMNYQDYNGFRYFWISVSGLADATWYSYFYQVDEKYNVADPYGRVVLDRTEDATLPSTVFPDRPAYPAGQTSRMAAWRSDIDTYNWEVTSFTPADRSTLTIYEMLVRDFTGTNGKANGEGTLRSAMEKLPYLKDLGITAIELMPVMEFDYNSNWGYDTNSHFAVDKAYGSPSDMRAFVDLCHKNGIAVIMDMVFNHVTDNHAWAAMYEKGSSPFINSTAPHAWSVHNDLKQEYGLVEPYIYDVVDYWINNYKIDGFRFDLVKGMGDSNSYGAMNSESYYGNTSNSTTVNRMKRIHAHMKQSNPNILHINEFFGHYDDDCAMGNDGQMVWNHQHTDAQHYAAGMEQWQDGDNINGPTYGDLEWCSWSKISRPQWGTVDYIESHDEQWLGYMAKTFTSNVNIKGHPDVQANRLAALGAQLLIAYGPKMIWQFGELGYDEMLGSDRLAKKPVHWEYLEDANKLNIHDTYKAMIAVRNNNPELFASSVTPQYNNFSQKNENARTIRLVKGDKEVIVFVNPSSYQSQTASCTASFLSSGNYQVVASAKGFTPVLSKSGSTVSVTIPANQFCVLATNNVVLSSTSTGGNEGGNQGGNEGGNQGGNEQGGQTGETEYPSSTKWYLCGSDIADGNSVWADNETYRMKCTAANTYTISLPELKGQIKFKEQNTWDTCLGSNGTKLKANVEYTASVGTSTDNIVIDGTIYNAVITVNTSTKKVMITGTSQQATSWWVSVPCASNDWSKENKVEVPFTGNGIAEVTVEDFQNVVEGVTGQGFKVCVDSDWYSTGGEVTPGIAVTLSTENDDNMTIAEAYVGKTLKFTYNVNTKQLLVEEVVSQGDPDPDPQPTVKTGDLNGDGFVDISDVYYLIDLIHAGAR